MMNSYSDCWNVRVSIYAKPRRKKQRQCERYSSRC
jgi:hypothetical protein